MNAPHTILALAVETALDRGVRVPCRDRPEWLSDDPEQRAEAAEACQSCPVITLCSEAADARPRQQFGVWGGRDRTRTPRLPLSPPQEAPSRHRATSLPTNRKNPHRTDGRTND